MTSIVMCGLVEAYGHREGWSVPTSAFHLCSQMVVRCARGNSFDFCYSALPAPAGTAHPVDALDCLHISLNFCKFVAEGV